MGISYRCSVEDQISILTVLSHKAVAGVLKLFAANIQSWFGCAPNKLTAVQIPVMEEKAFLLLAVVLKEIASFLNLTNLLTQRHCIVYVGDWVGLYLLIQGWITFSNSEVLAVIRYIPLNVF